MQAFINQFMQLQKLRVALQQIKLRLLELAQAPAVREVLAQPRALLQLKVRCDSSRHVHSDHAN